VSFSTQVLTPAPYRTFFSLKKLSERIESLAIDLSLHQFVQDPGGLNRVLTLLRHHPATSAL
jgi:hypothetical protein